MRSLTRRSLLLSLAASPALAKKKKKKGKNGQQSDNLGLISGTVFQASGLSFRGAKVTAIAVDDAKTKFEILSDGRGEFNFRAPAGAEPGTARSYTVRAEAKGYQPAEKKADVYLGQRTNINLILAPEE
jgi:hypothetical protein